MPGPIPNREEDLARPRERKGSDQQSVTKGVMRPVTIPHADKDWHPIARKIWDSLKTSGMADFYQQTDWALAYSLMDDLSKMKKNGRPSSQWAQVIYQQLGTLGLSEGERRRMRIELHEPDDGATDVEDEAISSYENELMGSVTPIRR